MNINKFKNVKRWEDYREAMGKYEIKEKDLREKEYLEFKW